MQALRTVVLGAGLLIPAGPAPAAPRYVVLDDVVRVTLARAWNRTDPQQHERGYCVAYTPGTRWGVSVYRVWAIAPAEAASSTPNTIAAECPVGPNIAFLHTHPPATCDPDTPCVLEGSDSYECFPSEQDQHMLDASGDAFGLIQCDTHAVIFYFPTRQRP